jgi:hypothetical protein
MAISAKPTCVPEQFGVVSARARGALVMCGTVYVPNGRPASNGKRVKRKLSAAAGKKILEARRARVGKSTSRLKQKAA